ncbi:MAG: amidohydrolase family protein [Pirellulales bacterium]|nr:amidohydrolase family protein [Pirellulales bacterium]
MIDVNCYLGHYAFRQLRNNTADGLLRVMDAKGIEKAVVGSAAAVTYRNAQSGNEELHREIKSHRDRLIPFAVINPGYAGWVDDLKICREDFGMSGVRLHPGWHNYKPADTCCRELVAAATEHKMPVSIPIRVEDNRQRHWLVDVPDVRLGEIVDLVKNNPQATFILASGRGFKGCDLGKKNNSLPRNYYIEICRASALLDNEIGQLVENLGADRLLFGTGMPFHYPDPAILKLKVLDIPEADKEKIRRANAAGILG